MELIGRDRERLEVTERLGQRRLVTLLGPAGIGKTAVARAVTTEVADRFELGAHHIDLTRIEAAASVAGAIAAQLGFASFDDLIGSPSEQPALLLVDNCEHVTDAAAEAIAALLEACEAPTVLATSRSPLGLPGESIVALGPLAGDDAVRLFLERARDAGATVSDGQQTVVELCRALDGLPLAIELAAARTRVLQPAEILSRLAEGVEVLARPRFRGDQRHRSLGATIEWSYRLLPDDVAAVFERLALFVGPFSATMATTVAADAGLDADAAADALEFLVDSSLVVAEPGGDGTSFRLLQTVRAFALSRLRDRGALEDANRRLGDHVARAAMELLLAGGERWEPSMLWQLLSLYDTITSTLRWCIDHDDDSDRSLLLCSVLWGVIHQGHTEEIATLCDATLRRWPDPDLDFAADARATAATARLLLGDPDGARALAESTLPHVGTSGTAPVTLRRALGLAALSTGDRPLALRRFSEVSTIGRANGVLALALEADVTRALLVALDDNTAGRALALATQHEAAAVGSLVNEVWARSVAAHLLLRSDVAAGRAEAVAALDEARRIAYPAGVGVNLLGLAWADMRAGDHGRAAAALLELLDDLFARSGVADLRGVVHATAELLHAAGDPAWAELAATVPTLTVVGLVRADVDGQVRFPPPPADLEPLSRRDAITTARAALQRVLAGASSRPSVGSPTSESASTNRFVVQGGFVEIEYRELVIHAKASKGLGDIGRLLAAPGREIHCTELMGAAVEQGGAGEAIDARARRQYEERIRDLQADVEAAEADNDFIRAERAQVELDALVEHLAAALGLSGRARGSGGGTVERARSAVTQRIRSTIRRLASESPALARHLEASIVTGTYCSYRPERPVPWEVSSPAVTP